MQNLLGYEDMERHADANNLIIPEKLRFGAGKHAVHGFRKTRSDWREYENECNKELLRPDTIELLDGLMQWSYLDRLNFFKRALDLPLYAQS
jgi:hypothetical protein